MEEIAPRTRLLTKKGRLTESGWATGDAYIYNKEVLHRRARLREWELYQLSNARFAFRVFYGHCAAAGRAGATLVDFETGERYSSGRPQLFPGDGFDLDFFGGEPHTLKYEDKDSFLSVSFDGEVRRIIVRSDRFDADLSCHDAGDAIVTAANFDSRNRFACVYKKNFPDLAGYVHMHKLDYRLDGETFLVLSSGRGLWPYASSRLWFNAAWESDGRVVALNLGDNGGTSGPVTENALFVGGRMEKLGQVSLKYRDEDLMEPWRIFDSDRRLHLEFVPESDNRTKLSLGAVSIRSRQLFGALSGTVELESGETLSLEGVRAFAECARERM